MFFSTTSAKSLIVLPSSSCNFISSLFISPFTSLSTIVFTLSSVLNLYLPCLNDVFLFILVYMLKVFSSFIAPFSFKSLAISFTVSPFSTNIFISFASPFVLTGDI